MVTGCRDCAGKQHLITARVAASGTLALPPICFQALRDVNRDQKAV
jgi:hypothetical protein